MTSPVASEPNVDALFSANEDAATFYRQHLLGPDGTGPRLYLTERGFAHLLDDTPWTIGHAPAGWTALHDHLADLGYTDAAMLAAGLITRSRRGTPIDRFRNRITFGIRDLDGHLIAFTARAAPGAADTVPRYLNSPCTAIYDKSRSLFGLGEVAAEIRNGATPVLVEGPFDALAIDATNNSEIARHAAFALCGTACTSAHGDQLARLTNGAVVVALDNDPAGAGAALRACIALSTTHRDLQTVTLRSADPAELLRTNGPAVLREELGRRGPLATRIIDEYLATWPNVPDNAEASVSCLRGAARLLSQMGTREISRHASRLGQRLNLPCSVVTREICEYAAPTRDLARVRASPASWRRFVAAKTTVGTG